jgi:hypothetical protein
MPESIYTGVTILSRARPTNLGAFEIVGRTVTQSVTIRKFGFADTRRGMAARGRYIARRDEKDIRRSRQRLAFCICMSSCIEAENVQCLLFAAGNSECHRFCCDRVHVTIYYGTCAGSAYLR